MSFRWAVSLPWVREREGNGSSLTRYLWLSSGSPICDLCHRLVTQVTLPESAAYVKPNRIVTRTGGSFLVRPELLTLAPRGSTLAVVEV